MANMSRYAKMTMMQRGREETRSNYDAESRFRDRRGREHYDNGRFAPMRNSMEHDGYGYMRAYGGEMRGGMAYGNGGEMRGAYPGRSIPVRSEQGYDMEGTVWPVYADPVRQIGFSAHGGEWSGGHMSHGGAAGSARMDRATAETWVRNLGQNWTMEQAKQIMTRYGYACDPVEFWVALNMMQSDYSRVAAVCGSDKEEFYAAMAHAFLDDKDALPGKLSRYYHAIVKRD